jgi:PAS domain S-box-containing protein
MGIAHLDTAGKAPGSPEPEARLRLVEALLDEGDGRNCAELALAWLAQNVGCQRSLLLVVDPDEDRLRGLCGLGCDDGAVRAMSVDLTDRTHPLSVALESHETVVFDGPGEGQRRPPPETPLGPVPFLSFPLCPDAETPHGAVGLLLLEDPDRRAGLREALEWVGSLLANRLAALAYFRQQKAGKRQRRERDWLRGVLEAVTDPILLTDGEGRILIANRGAEHLLTTDEETGEGRRRAVALNNMLFSASLFTNADAGGPSRRELLLVDPVDGHDLLYELMTTPFPLDESEVGMVSILRDVTDLSRATTEIEENYRRLRAAESETRAERDRLDVILSSVLDPILVTDPVGNIVLMNPHAERLFTVPSGNQDREAERRVRANDAVFTSFASDIYAGRSLRWKKDLSLSDPETGKQIPMEAVSAKTLSRPGQDTAVVTILHDQSEAVEKAKLYEQVKRHSEELEERVLDATRELAEQNETLRRQALQLEHASAMKSQFLANVSHELRTPLHAIVGYTSLMMEGVAGEMTPPQREKLGRVDSNAQHLLAIINDLLDLTRIESGKMPIRIEEFRLSTLFDEVKTEAESLILASNLQVRFDVPDHLPPMASDRQKVKQILLNLLSNALKFTPGGRVDVEGSWDEGEDFVTIAVADTGVGISEKHQKTIFEAFGQTGTFYTAGQTGTGLGLSICRRLATILGGDMTLESEEGEGARFTLELPRISEET